MQQVAADTFTLSAVGEQTVWVQVADGAVVLLLATDATTGDEFVIRQYASVDGGTAVVASKRIEFGVSTDDTWDGAFGGDNAGWQSWPMAFGSGGGSIVVEWVGGSSFDLSFVVLNVAGPEG